MNRRSLNIMNQSSFKFLALTRKFSLLTSRRCSKARIILFNQNFKQKVQSMAAYFYSLFECYH